MHYDHAFYIRGYGFLIDYDLIDDVVASVCDVNDDDHDRVHDYDCVIGYSVRRNLYVTYPWGESMSTFQNDGI